MRAYLVFFTAIFFVPIVYGQVAVYENASLIQDENHADVNVSQPFNTSTLSLYSDATNFNGSNFSADAGGSKVLVRMEFYNASVGEGLYLSNFSADVVPSASTSFTFNGLFVNDYYRVRQGGDGVSIPNSSLNGQISFNFASWGSSFLPFDVFNLPDEEAFNTEQTDVVKNEPVEPGKRILWRRCKRYENPNKGDVSVSERISVPLGGQEFRLESQCSGSVAGNAITTTITNSGRVVPVSVDVPAGTNKTRGIWFTTSGVSLSPSPYVVEQPDEFYVGEDAAYVLNFSVVSQSPIRIETDNQIRVAVPLEFGNDVEVFEEGSFFRDLGNVRGGHLFNLSNLSVGAERDFSFRYDIPVAESERILPVDNSTNAISGEGNNMTVYKITSRSPRPLDDVRLHLEEVDCVEIVRAVEISPSDGSYEEVRELEVICGRTDEEGGSGSGDLLDSSQIKIGELEQRTDANPVYVRIDWRSSDPRLAAGPGFRSRVAEWLARMSLLALIISSVILFRNIYTEGVGDVV